MLAMRTCGGHRPRWAGLRRRTLRGAATAIAATTAVALLAGCTEESDHTRNAETRLSKVEHVATVELTPSSWDRVATIVVGYADIDSPRGLARLLADLAEAIEERGYRTYRLELSEVDGDGDLLVVDETLIEREDADAVIDAWFEATEELLGPVTYVVESGAESITVDSAGGIGHDVATARRIGGRPGTTWVFRNRETRFAATAPVTASDVELFDDVHREAASTSLPVAADGWRLDRRFGHVRLDLEVDVPGVSGSSLTVADHGADLRRLARAALTALDGTGLPAFLSLREATAESVDVFGTWTSTQRPAPGRDPEDRGWDRWLRALARA